MKAINESLREFTSALDSGKSVCCDVYGHWYCQNDIVKKITHAFGCDHLRLKRVASHFFKVLDLQEAIAVDFNGSSPASKGAFKIYFAACEALKIQLSGNIKCQKQLQDLEQRYIALKYRVESRHLGGVDPNATSDAGHLLELLKDAAEWKKQQHFYPYEDDRNLNKRDKDRLGEAARFPLFTALLKTNKQLRQTFFEWVIRDGGRVRQFIEYPSTWLRLKRSFLTSRIAYYGSDLLSIVVKKNQKFLSLPMELSTSSGLKIKKINILNPEKTVTLAKGWQLTLKNVMKIFKRKNDEIGDLEFFSTGIKNWNCHRLSSRDPTSGQYESIDFSQEKWWEALPVQEIISSKQLKERYSKDDKGNPLELNDRQWLAVVRSTRGSQNLDIDKSHGFIEIAIPNGKGAYQLYDFGKFASNFPITLLQKLSFLANTVKSKISYPDENIVYHSRQHAAVAFPLSDKEGVALMSNIAEDLLKARQGNLIFQFAWENCAYWPQTLMEKLRGKVSDGGTIADFFKKQILDVRTLRPLSNVFTVLKKLSARLQEFFLRIVELLTGAWRGVFIRENGQKVFKSLSTSPFRRWRCSYIPSTLHSRILEGSISGNIWWGSP